MSQRIQDPGRQGAYFWPDGPLDDDGAWSPVLNGTFLRRALPETREQLAADSRWPAFFPSPMCLVTARDGDRVAFEKVVGPSVVNRFPLTVAISVCREALSARHHPRTAFMDILEAGGAATVQFVDPGPALERAMSAIVDSDERTTTDRLARAGLQTHSGVLGDGAPLLNDAFMAYETVLVPPQTGLSGGSIHETPWLDLGSHRVCFLQVRAIHLRADIARGETQVAWNALPDWQPEDAETGFVAVNPARRHSGGYTKGYTPRYRFPAAGTVGFDHDRVVAGMAIRELNEDQVETDPDKARWPCFFPSSLGMITAWTQDGIPNLMPCGSTTVLSRHPMTVGVAVCHVPINARYAPRVSLDYIRRTGRFGCGVAYVSDRMIDAIRYSGNVTMAADPDKLANSGLSAVDPGAGAAPLLPALPITFDCALVGERDLGTHVLVLGEVRSILVRSDVTPAVPLAWSGWGVLETAR